MKTFENTMFLPNIQNICVYSVFHENRIKTITLVILKVYGKFTKNQKEILKL